MRKGAKFPTRRYSNYLFLLVAGFGVGWLVGLSVSPVLYIVLGSVLTILVGTAGALAGMSVIAVELIELGQPEIVTRVIALRRKNQSSHCVARRTA